MLLETAQYNKTSYREIWWKFIILYLKIILTVFSNPNDSIILFLRWFNKQCIIKFFR